MTPNIIVSYDGTDNDHDALALAHMFADSGASVSLAYVRHTPESEERREQLAQHEAEQLLERGAQWLGTPDAERHVILSASTGEGLWTLAEQRQADIVVFGSDWHTAPGHVQPGSSALRMLSGAPVAVAIAPARLRDHATARLELIAVAGGDTDPAAQETARSLAAHACTDLVGPSDEGVDLLVVGSRPGTSPGRVGVSAASEYLVETANASVLVLPRGVAVSFSAPVPLGA